MAMTGDLAHEGVGQPRGQVRRADALGHADARAAGGAGVAVGHVGGGLLAVGDDAADVHVLHFRHDAKEGGGHLEYACDAVGLQHFCYVAISGHSRHGPTSVVRGVGTYAGIVSSRWWAVHVGGMGALPSVWLTTNVLTHIFGRFSSRLNCGVIPT